MGIMANQKELNDLLDEMYCAQTGSELDKSMRRICDYHMVGKFSLAAISKRSGVGNDVGLLDSYPIEWMKRYMAQHYDLIDPVFHGVQHKDLFFCWHIEKFKDITLQQKKMLKEADDFGIRFGTTLSLLPTQEYRYVMTLLDANIDNAHVLHGVAMAANYYVRERQKREITHTIKTLTNKQQEILALKKKGYPIKKIADVLGKDISTIHLHLYNIKEKLAVTSSDQVMYAYGFFDGIQKK